MSPFSFSCNITPMHVLIVEDDPRILKFLKVALFSEGNTTSTASSLESAQTELSEATAPFEMVILDRMLVGNDGAKLIPEIKRRLPACGILVLSALSESSEKAQVLDLGADDYIAKPFTLQELTARIRSIERRIKSSVGGRLIRLGDLSLDLVSHRLSVGGKPIDLSQKEFQVFLMLAQEPGRVHSRFQLLDCVWNTQFDVESNVVEVTVNNLRRKLEASKAQAMILSKRGVGYWLET
ncbi:MAG: response regulator transcription factor [Deltaproteobacteria bacterium]|nr:response regulator transcription factor [Deltaproteobacteria bacterium]